MTTPARGTRACYLRGCQHPECHDAHKRYCKEYDVRRYRDGAVNIDAAAATAHLRHLTERGWTQAAIAEGTGICSSTISNLCNGAQVRISRRLNDTILAFQPGDAPAANYWQNPAGTIRRIQALAAIGWPVYRQAEAAGTSDATLRQLLGGRNLHVARPVADLYERWSTQPGPSAVTRGRAAANQWRDPQYWDDMGAIDDPGFDPDRAEQPHARIEVVAEDAAWLLDAGFSREHVTERLGVSWNYVHKALRAAEQGVAA